MLGIDIGMSCHSSALTYNWLLLRDQVSREPLPLCVRSPTRSPFRVRGHRQRTQCSSTKTTAGETRRPALGGEVIETDEDLEEPREKDFWEGGAWDVRPFLYTRLCLCSMLHVFLISRMQSRPMIKRPDHVIRVHALAVTGKHILKYLRMSCCTQ